VRFLYVQRLAFGGRVSGRTFGVDASSPARFDVGKLEPMLAEIHDRLQSVVIERLPYAEFIRRYDRNGALFYLDPPYWACERDYGPDVFTREDFAALASQLATIKGKFLVSLNDTEGVRETFAPSISPPSPRPTPQAPSPARPENCSSATSRSPATITEAVPPRAWERGAGGRDRPVQAIPRRRRECRYTPNPAILSASPHASAPSSGRLYIRMRDLSGAGHVDWPGRPVRIRES
jgi:hypothetical protein